MVMTHQRVSPEVVPVGAVPVIVVVPPAVAVSTV